MARLGGITVAGSLPRAVLLYADASAGPIDPNEIAAYLRTTLGLPTRVRPEFVAHHFRG